MCITVKRMQAYSAYRHISVVFNAMTTLQLKSANNYILLIQQHRSKPLHYTRSHPNCSLSRSPFSHYSQQHILLLLFRHLCCRQSLLFSSSASYMCVCDISDMVCQTTSLYDKNHTISYDFCHLSDISFIECCKFWQYLLIITDNCKHILSPNVQWCRIETKSLELHSCGLYNKQWCLRLQQNLAIQLW